MSNNKTKHYLEDIIDDKTRIVFCGMAAGELSYEKKHYYANSTNRFWKVLYQADLIQKEIIPIKDLGGEDLNRARKHNYNLLKETGIGLTDLVKDQMGVDKNIKLNKEYLVKYRQELFNLIEKNKQVKVWVFNGIGLAKKIFGRKLNDPRICQSEKINKQDKKGLKETVFMVIPSTSGMNGRYSIDYIVSKLKPLTKFIHKRGS